MKAISIGKRYEIYNDTMKTYDVLPAKTYTVRFEEQSGFYLEERAGLSVNEKVYGAHTKKAEKVMHSFSLFNRNMGVILSGDKGIGKSLFARCLCEKAISTGYPVIIIDQFIPGIAAYIESIDQEAVFLFDEFDKTFGDIRAGDNEANPQARMLSLFDGTAQGKKLFVITCNSLHRLSDYLVNRPGRFHYHFRFEYPAPEEITAYLTDKLGGQYQAEIKKVTLFSKKVSLNYDCLRAIAFELSLGESFEEAIQDLNIINESEERYDITLYCKGNIVLTAKAEPLDLFNRDQRACIYLRNGNTDHFVQSMFSPADCAYDPKRGVMVLSGDHVFLRDRDGSDTDQEGAGLRELIPEYMTLVRTAVRNLHYLTA